MHKTHIVRKTLASMRCSTSLNEKDGDGATNAERWSKRQVDVGT